MVATVGSSLSVLSLDVIQREVHSFLIVPSLNLKIEDASGQRIVQNDPKKPIKQGKGDGAGAESTGCSWRGGPRPGSSTHGSQPPVPGGGVMPSSDSTPTMTMHTPGEQTHMQTKYLYNENKQRYKP